MRSPGWVLWVSVLVSSCGSVDTPKDPDDLLDQQLLDEARGSFLRGEFEATYGYAEALLERTSDPALSQESLFLAGKARLGDDERKVAFRRFERLLEDYPYSGFIPGLEEDLFGIGVEYLDREPSWLFGDLFSGRPFGVEVLRQFVANFPRSSSADDALFRTAAYYFEREEFDFAADKYKALVDQYPESEWFDLSFFRVGLCHLQSSRGAGYDSKDLSLARGNFMQYLNYPRRGEFGDEAEGKLGETEELLARTQVEIAEFYLLREADRGARVHLANAVLAYPTTTAAQEAREMLEERGWDVSVNSLDTLRTGAAPAKDGQ